MSNEEVLRARSRVVDHWKRLFAIVSGFAITVACGRAYSCLLVGDIDGLTQFVAFIVTLLPVFHGMERSLDLRYLQPRSPIPHAARLIGDTGVLLITALFFLLLALSIPDHGQAWLMERSELLRSWFPRAFVGFLVFDAIVLVVTRTRLKTVAPETGAHDAHARLAALNAVAALVVGIGVIWLDVLTRFGLAVVALVRSGIDYGMSSSFLYPQAALADPPPPSGRR